MERSYQPNTERCLCFMERAKDAEIALLALTISNVFWTNLFIETFST